MVNPTPKSKSEGIKDSFGKFLQKFELDNQLLDIFRLQLSHSIEAFNEENIDLEKN